MVFANTSELFPAGPMGDQLKLMLQPHALPLSAIRRRALEKLKLKPRRLGISFDPSDRTALEHRTRHTHRVKECIHRARALESYLFLAEPRNQLQGAVETPITSARLLKRDQVRRIGVEGQCGSR
jgi:hypothetical protein